MNRKKIPAYSVWQKERLGVVEKPCYPTFPTSPFLGAHAMIRKFLDDIPSIFLLGQSQIRQNRPPQ